MGQIGVLKLAATIRYPGLQGHFFMAMLVVLFSEFCIIFKRTQLGLLQTVVIHNPMAEKCSNSGFAIQNTPKSG